jgi:hypothetical protein
MNATTNHGTGPSKNMHGQGISRYCVCAIRNHYTRIASFSSCDSYDSTYIFLDKSMFKYPAMWGAREARTLRLENDASRVLLARPTWLGT